MFEFLSDALSIDGFMPHGMCFQWRPDVLWMHLISDLVIALAYFSIPLALAIVLLRRRRFPFKWLVGLFGAFILLCGATHVLGIVVLWDPIYRMQGLLKLATAAVSIATAVVLFPMLPSLMGAVDELERKVHGERARVP